MTEKLLSIGGLGVALSGGDTLRRAFMVEGMEVFLSDKELHRDIEVRLDSVLSQPHCRLLHDFDIVDGQYRCRFGINDEGVYYYDFGGVGLLRYDLQSPGVVEISEMTDVSALRFALWTAYAMAGLRHGAVPVHSSVVVCDGRAVMCLGESGTGKSTHTRLWCEHVAGSTLLNDDSPILRYADGEVRVYGSPWSGKTPCYRTESYPVAGLLRLEQRPVNSIRRLGVVEAFAALHPSCPPSFARDERAMDALVAFISNILERVPVFRMGCLPDADAARLSHDTIIG